MVQAAENSMLGKTTNKNVSMDLSIIFVNWNSKDYLRKSIASLETAIQGIDFEIVVIDAASYDGCDEMLRINFPTVRFIQGVNNLGFANGNNEAYGVARGSTLLFLNPDTEIEGSAIKTLYHELNALPNAGIVGPKLLNSDRSVQQSCVRAFPTILNQVLECDTLRKLFPRSRLWGMKPLLAGNEAAKAVDAVSGACLMVKRAVFESVGMFSTDYFMYSEEIDLCLKVRKAGLNTYYIPRAVVVHHGGASSAQMSVNTFSTVMMLESRSRFFRKTRSLWYSGLYRLAMFGASIVRIGLLLFVWLVSGLCGRVSPVEPMLKKWMARLRWTLGRENWVRNY